MPVVSWQQLPDWKGYTIPMGLWLSHYGNSMAYEKENVEVLGDLGFNFVRVPLDSRTIFKGSDMSMVNPAYLETMDDLVEYCAEAGIHVCFDLHDMPGFYTGGDDSKITLWDDEETQELFVAFWRFLAEYYKDVPSNLLSFNLLNEPHDAYGSTGCNLTEPIVQSGEQDHVFFIYQIFEHHLGISFHVPVKISKAGTYMINQIFSD